MEIGFTHPSALWLLPLALVPLLPLKRNAVVFSSLAPADPLPRSWCECLCCLQPWIAALTLLALFLALAGPESRQRIRRTLREGIDLMLALDISASMASDDLPPERIQIARTTAADFLQGRPNDRVGVILFSGIPYLLSPPTTETAPLIARLRTVQPDKLGSGTAVGDALAAALGRLKHSAARSKAVVLLTDGASNRGRVTPLASARAAEALGVRVYTIGFGEAAGTSHPTGSLNPLPGPPTDSPDHATLRSMAGITGGRYFRATDRGTLAEVYRRIDALEKSPLTVSEQFSSTPMGPGLLLLGGVLALLELLLFRVVLRRVP